MIQAQGSATVVRPRAKEIMSVGDALDFFCEKVRPLCQTLPPMEQGGREVLELLEKLEADGRYVKISPLDLVSVELAEIAKNARDVLVEAERNKGGSVRWGAIDQWDMDIPSFFRRGCATNGEVRQFVVWVSINDRAEYLRVWDDKPDGYLFTKPKQ